LALIAVYGDLETVVPWRRLLVKRGEEPPDWRRAYPDFLLHGSLQRPLMWFSLKRTT